MRGFLQRFRPKTALCNLPLCETIERICNILEDIEGYGGIRIDKPTGGNGCGWRVILDNVYGANGNVPPNFSCTLATNTSGGYEVSVRFGSIRMHGIGTYPVAGAIVSLTAAAEWVYVWHDRDHTASGIDHSAVEPASTTTRLYIPLARYALRTSGVYEQEELCWHGDIHFDSPLR